MFHQVFSFCMMLIFLCWRSFVIAQSGHSDEEMIQLADLLGLSPASARLKRQPSLSNSATKFLLEVYKEISDQGDSPEVEQQTRHRRAVADENFITAFDRREIELSNNIITFASRPTPFTTNSALSGDMLLNFNLNDIPSDLELIHAAVRLYQDPQVGRHGMSALASQQRNFTISLYQPVGQYLLAVAAINASTDFRGWLELNVTHLFNNWLHFRTLQQTLYGNEVLVGVTLHSPLVGAAASASAADVGLVPAHTQSDSLGLQPFIIGYFNGPDLMTKMKKRSTKQHTRRERHVDAFGHKPPPSMSRFTHPEAIYEQPKACERRNFTLDFKYLGMEKSVIAPKTFEAYFCLGECNFPLGTPMNNATNHAIVQTLMHLKRPNLPKPCCVPIKLASISILYSVNEDSVNLMRFSQIVAKECGCR
ncbi:protein screw-like isoform X1 [Rhagoletis pomonella]|uniref:protein screw-like isoform X1 n=2 Tax=Rhagoletis pomonella TaxID=28610 RepID=UPI00177F0AFD|nr:protein screw-like isoform X1 [Rhagoletis pomonella]XP_036345633.1 protein screw-like isoform X1 [Rhagoletis pomonella]